MRVAQVRMRACVCPIASTHRPSTRKPKKKNQINKVLSNNSQLKQVEMSKWVIVKMHMNYFFNWINFCAYVQEAGLHRRGNMNRCNCLLGQHLYIIKENEIQEKKIRKNNIRLHTRPAPVQQPHAHTRAYTQTHTQHTNTRTRREYWYVFGGDTRQIVLKRLQRKHDKCAHTRAYTQTHTITHTHTHTNTHTRRVCSYIIGGDKRQIVLKRLQRKHDKCAQLLYTPARHERENNRSTLALKKKKTLWTRNGFEVSIRLFSWLHIHTQMVHKKWENLFGC